MSLAMQEVEAVETTSRKLFLLVLLTSISLFLFGYNTASISGALLYIDEENFDCRHEPICLTDSVQKGYVVSSCLVGAAAGALFAGQLADRFGRRTVLLANNFFYILGPIGMAVAPDLHWLAASRALAGVGVGIASALVHVYIGENVPASRRGEHGAILVMMGTFGILVATGASWLLQEQWRIVLGLAALPAILQLTLGPLLMPESPCWVQMQQQRRSEARRRPLLCAEVQEQEESAQSEKEGGWTALWAALKSGKALQPLIVGVGLQILQQISGINVAVYYGPKIFTIVGFSKDKSTLLSAVLSGVQMAATLLLARFIDKIGRRPMCFIGLWLMVASLSALGTAFTSLLPDSESKSLAVLSLLAFRVAFSLSLGPLPYIITAEIFPASYRTSGVSLCWFVNWLSNSVVSLTFLPLMQVMQMSGTFYMYAVVCCMAMVFIKFCVKETSGQDMDKQLSDPVHAAISGSTSL